MKCSEVILKVTDFPVKLFYEMPLWGASLTARLIKVYEKYKKENPRSYQQQKARTFYVQHVV